MEPFDGSDLPCRIVYEPDHSREVLRNYESTYGIASADLSELDALGYDFGLPVEVLMDWTFHYKIFLKTGGDPSDLVMSRWTTSQAGRPLFFEVA